MGASRSEPDHPGGGGRGVAGDVVNGVVKSTSAHTALGPACCCRSLLLIMLEIKSNLIMTRQI